MKVFQRFWLCFCLLAAVVPLHALAEDAELDLRSIPISDWLTAGKATEVPWNIRIDPARLRMDQRMELTYSVTIRGKDLNRGGNTHELFLFNRVSDPSGLLMR